MLQSIRARLTAWYAAVFAVFATVFAVASYSFVARATGARIDESLAETVGAVIDELEAELATGESTAGAIISVMREFRLGDAAVAVFDRATGATAIAFETEPEPTGRHRRAAPPDYRAVLRAAPAEPAFATVRAPGAPVRVFTVPYRFGGRHLIVSAAESLAGQRRTLREARTALAIGAPLILLAAITGGYALARKGLNPVALMTVQAARIGAGTLHERLPVHTAGDELGRLATVFNDLLGRLEAAFERQRRFMADASHELRTPVAIVTGEAELALARADRSPDELRSALATIEGEAARMRRIIEELLLLARADAGEQPIAKDELYLSDLIDDSTRAVRSLAAGKDISVTSDIRGDLPFRGDEGLLRRLLLNLLDNAIKYTPAGGHVAIRAEQDRRSYVIAVSDTGPGIPPEVRERIFDRFFRAAGGGAEPASGSGAGLGLAIARWIAAAHGGRLELTRSDATGSTFTVSLPLPDSRHA